MKTKSILIALAAILAAGCNDFLDPKSPSTFDTKYVFSNTEDARKAVNAVYTYFDQDAFRSRLSNNMTGNTDIEHQSGWGSTADRYQIWDLNALPSNNDLNVVWNNAYGAIRDSNVSIEGLLASPLLNSSDAVSSKTMYNLLGEAYTLRAYWYSMLAFYFGDVPFVKEAPKPGANFYLPKEDRNVILSYVIQDLIDIEGKMSWGDELPHGIEQVNREFTLGMIARLALQRGGYFLKPDMTMSREDDYLSYYQIAKDYTQKLMTLKDRPLPTNFRQIFMNECTFQSPVNQDVLFEVPFAIGNGDVGWNIGVTVQTTSPAKHPYGSGNNYMAMPPTYFYSFDTLDIRRDVTCGMFKVNADFKEEFIGVGSGASALNISQGKWSRYYIPAANAPGPSSAKGTGINWPMMRYADVLLMFAEAENELNGPTADAQNALKRVRQRAFDASVWSSRVDSYINTVSTSKQAFFDAIVNERAWEFGGEMIRKYELIRWGNYSQKMAKMVQDLKNMADGVFAGTSTLPDYLYWKLDANGKFTMLNPNKKILSADASWTKTSFLLTMHNNTTQYQDWIVKDWANYTNGVVRYIFPLPTTAVSNSQGVLQNDGYGFIGG